MTWIYRKADQHSCQMPIVACPGDVWRCDTCGLMHVRQDSQRDGQYWEAAPAGSDLWSRTAQRLRPLGIDITTLPAIPLTRH